MSDFPQSEAFQKAAIDSRKLKAKPNQDDLLQLYGLYKQGTQDPPIEKSETPGTFDFKVPLIPCLSSMGFPLIAETFYPKGKAKKRAWQSVVDDGVTPEEAQSRYVALVESLKETYGYDADKEPEAVGAGS